MSGLCLDLGFGLVLCLDLDLNFFGFIFGLWFVI